MEPPLFLTQHSQLGLNAKFYLWRTKEERHRLPLETQRRDSMHKTSLLFVTNYVLSFIFGMFIFWPCFSTLKRAYEQRIRTCKKNCHKRKNKQAKTDKQYTGTEDLFKIFAIKWWARSTDFRKRCVLVQLSPPWFSISLFSWFSLFLAAHWEQPPQLSNKTPQS